MEGWRQRSRGAQPRCGGTRQHLPSPPPRLPGARHGMMMCPGLNRQTCSRPPALRDQYPILQHPIQPRDGLWWGVGEAGAGRGGRGVRAGCVADRARQRGRGSAPALRGDPSRAGRWGRGSPGSVTLMSTYSQKAQSWRVRALSLTRLKAWSGPNDVSSSFTCVGRGTVRLQGGAGGGGAGGRATVPSASGRQRPTWSSFR